MTGPTNRNNLPLPIVSLLEAARDGNLSALFQQVDFAVSGLALMVCSLHEVDEPDRESVAREGLADLESSGRTPDLARGLLENLRHALVSATNVHIASAGQTAIALGALRVRNIPSGLSPETRERLESLAVRCEAARVVYVVAGAPILGNRLLYLAILPGTGRIAIPKVPTNQMLDE